MAISTQDGRERLGDKIFVETVRRLVISRNLLREHQDAPKERRVLTDHGFFVLLDAHLAVVQALCAHCETASRDRRWIDGLNRHITLLRKALEDRRHLRGNLSQEINALAKAEDTALLPMATLIMAEDAWVSVAFSVDRLGQAIRDTASPEHV